MREEEEERACLLLRLSGYHVRTKRWDCAMQFSNTRPITDLIGCYFETERQLSITSCAFLPPSHYPPDCTYLWSSCTPIYINHLKTAGRGILDRATLTLLHDSNLSLPSHLDYLLQL